MSDIEPGRQSSLSQDHPKETESISSTDDVMDLLNFADDEDPVNSDVTNEVEEDNEADDDTFDTDSDVLAATALEQVRGHADESRAFPEAGHPYARIPSPAALGERPQVPPEAFDLSNDELASLRYFTIWSECRSTVAVYNKTVDFLRSLGHAMLSLHEVRKLARAVTGQEVLRADMCVRSCIAYVGAFSDLNHCPTCNEPRWRQQPSGRKQKSRKQYTYTPFTPRIRALFRNASTAQLLRSRDETLRAAKQDVREGTLVYADWSSGALARRLPLMETRDGAFTLSIDGAQFTHKTRSACWLILLVLLNIPASQGRYRKSNTIVLAAIPGPRNVGDIDSFLYFFFQEMAAAARGVWMWDAWTNQHFLWHGYLVAALGDQPASAKLSGLVGHNGCHGCRFCHIVGILSNKRGDKSQRGSYYFPLADIADSAIPARKVPRPATPYNPLDLPLRTESQYKAQLLLMAAETSDKGRATLRMHTGVSRRPLITASPFFSFPTFYPPDLAHLIFLNVTPHYWHYWIDKVLPKDEVDDFKTIMASASLDLPASFGLSPRTLPDSPGSGYRMHEWSAWLFWYSVPLLLSSNAFPTPLLIHWVSFVRAAHLATAYSLTSDDVDAMQAGFLKVALDNERLYIANDPGKIYLATMSIHQLLHVAHLTRELGPLAQLSQLPMERAIGEAGRSIHSAKEPWVNLANNITDDTVLHALQLCLPQSSNEGSRSAAGAVRTLGSRLSRPSARNDEKQKLLLALQNWLQDQYDNRDADEPYIAYYGVLHLGDDKLSSEWRDRGLAEGHKRASFFEVSPLYLASKSLTCRCTSTRMTICAILRRLFVFSPIQHPPNSFALQISCSDDLPTAYKIRQARRTNMLSSRPTKSYAKLAFSACTEESGSSSRR